MDTDDASHRGNQYEKVDLDGVSSEQRFYSKAHWSPGQTLELGCKHLEDFRYGQGKDREVNASNAKEELAA